MSDPGYPYDDVSELTPVVTGVDSSFIISENQHKPEEYFKKWLMIVVGLLILLSGVMTLVFMQKRQPIADIRNFAQEQGTPKRGFTGLVNTPASSKTTIVSSRVGSTPEPSRITKPSTFINRLKTIPAAISSFFTTGQAITPTLEPTLTPTQSQPTTTQTPTATPARIVTPAVTPSATPMAARQSVAGGPNQSPSPTLRPIETAPTATPVPVLSCQRVELFRGTEQVTQNIETIVYGDTIRFVGYVTNVGRQVESITFQLLIDDEVIEEKQAPAALSGNAWVAQYEHAFTRYGRHRVRVTSITPKP